MAKKTKNNTRSKSKTSTKTNCGVTNKSSKSGNNRGMVTRTG